MSSLKFCWVTFSIFYYAYQFGDSTLQHITRNITSACDLLYIHIIVFTTFITPHEAGQGQADWLTVVGTNTRNWENKLHRNADAKGKQKSLCVTAAKVKSKTHFTTSAASQHNVTCPTHTNGGVRVVFDSLCGGTGVAILSLALTEAHRAAFVTASGHNFWITTWNLPVKTRGEMC